MFRAIAYLIASILVLTLVRAVVGAIGRLFSGLTSPPAASPSTGKRPDAPVVESLQKDPVCGAFVAPSAAVQKTSGGKIYYFCSAACRDRFGA